MIKNTSELQLYSILWFWTEPKSPRHSAGIRTKSIWKDGSHQKAIKKGNETGAAW